MGDERFAVRRKLACHQAIIAGQLAAIDGVGRHHGDRLQLVAVEYVSTTPGEVLGMPLHFNSTVQLWVLRAWLFEHNHDGMHADFNPREGNCP